MAGYVIVVEFRIKSGQVERFRAAVGENARASVRDEPGCRRFDVLTSRADRDAILLYEIYDDRAAFEAHLKTAHFAAFDRASGPLVESRTIMEYDLDVEGSDPDR